MSRVAITVRAEDGADLLEDPRVRKDLEAAAGTDVRIRWAQPAPPRTGGYAPASAGGHLVELGLLFAASGVTGGFFSEAGKDAWAATKRLAARLWHREKPDAGQWDGFWVVEWEGGRVAVQLTPASPGQDATEPEIEEALERERSRVVERWPEVEEELRQPWLSPGAGEKVVYLVSIIDDSVWVQRRTTASLGGAAELFG